MGVPTSVPSRPYSLGAALIPAADQVWAPSLFGVPPRPSGDCTESGEGAKTHTDVSESSRAGQNHDDESGERQQSEATDLPGRWAPLPILTPTLARESEPSCSLSQRLSKLRHTAERIPSAARAEPRESPNGDAGRRVTGD